MSEPGLREKIVRMLWEKQFDRTAWAGKFDLIRKDSLGEYGEFADRLIAAIKADEQQDAPIAGKSGEQT